MRRRKKPILADSNFISLFLSVFLHSSPKHAKLISTKSLYSLVKSFVKVYYWIPKKNEKRNRKRWKERQKLNEIFFFFYATNVLMYLMKITIGNGNEREGQTVRKPEFQWKYILMRMMKRKLIRTSRFEVKNFFFSLYFGKNSK